MGNSMSFITKHGKRLKNRYNAQYRAIEFIGKENRSSAPRHPTIPANETLQGASPIEELQKKDLNLVEYLKGIYVQSHDKVPQDSADFHSRKNDPERPLPESREPRPIATFIEPECVEKGWCTITQISEFLASHEEDPEENNIAAIAHKYSLEEKKVENTLKYFSVFRVYDKVRDSVPRDEEETEKQTFLEGIEEVKEGKKKAEEFRKQLTERLSNTQDKEGSPMNESDKGSQPVEKAIKN